MEDDERTRVMSGPAGTYADWIRHLPDGTVKSMNPFTGVEVWTVSGRGNRPLGTSEREPTALMPDANAGTCAFCEDRYLESPPEVLRLVAADSGYAQLDRVAADQLSATTAEFRRVPNLFQIMSFEYWNQNYGYDLPAAALAARDAYLADPAGLEHVRSIAVTKARAAGRNVGPEDVGTVELLAASNSFFGSGHDLIIPRRHFTHDATHSTHLASSGTLTPDEHAAYMDLATTASAEFYDGFPHARYVAVFQNWLKPAGASFDHLHKQVVAVDDVGINNATAMRKLASHPQAYNDWLLDTALRHRLVLAENAHAIAFAGFGHRYPAIEVFSKDAVNEPWNQSASARRGLSDLVHAMHAAIGPEVACNEEWHTRPPGATVAMPWRIILKLRVSTLAGFEGGMRIYLTTVSPEGVRDRLAGRLVELRDAGLIAPVTLGDECPAERRSLAYVAGR
ncbi:MAG TPA: DUF4921 family protein [Propionibacteriaceae bacterium]|nr:DUF4921 family protein [Propionibacteriaceae bacterium]